MVTGGEKAYLMRVSVTCHGGLDRGGLAIWSAAGPQKCAQAAAPIRLRSGASCATLNSAGITLIERDSGMNADKV